MICHLKELRLARHLSQEELGELLGATREEVCLWEQGKRLPVPRRRRMVAAHFGIEPSEIWPLEPRADG